MNFQKLLPNSKVQILFTCLFIIYYLESIWGSTANQFGPVRSILSHPIDFRCFLDIRLAVGLASPFCPFSPSLAMRLWYFPVMSRLSDVLTLYFSYTGLYPTLTTIYVLICVLYYSTCGKCVS